MNGIFIKGRRASDGGSNISLFNQFYSLKNAYCNNNNNNNQCSSTNNNSDESNNNDSMAENGQSNPPVSFQSRGSITSGIPIFPAVQQPPSPNPGYAAGASSEDEDANMSTSSAIKYQRKMRSRHEPYTAEKSSSSGSGSLSSAPSQTSPTYKMRQREQSFSGTNSPPQHYLERYNGRTHRRSEPNALDLIYANRAHLERIYNQSINKSNLSPTQELLILQQENPSIDERIQIQWQKQHKNLKFNFAQVKHLSNQNLFCLKFFFIELIK